MRLNSHCLWVSKKEVAFTEIAFHHSIRNLAWTSKHKWVWWIIQNHSKKTTTVVMGNMIHHDNKPWKKYWRSAHFWDNPKPRFSSLWVATARAMVGLWAQRCGFLNLKKRWVIMSFLNRKGFRIVFGVFFFGSGFGFFFASFLVPFCLVFANSLELESVIFAWYLLHLAWLLCILHGICYILATFGHVCLPFFIVFATFLALQTSHLHGICYILVLQTFMWVSREFL